MNEYYCDEDYYYRRAMYMHVAVDVYVACFSVVNVNSFENIKTKWIPEAKHHSGERAPIILLGMKTELRRDAGTLSKLFEKGWNCVEYEHGEAMAKETGCIGYLEVSSERGYGMKEVTDMILQSYGAYNDRFKKKKKCRTQ